MKPTHKNMRLVLVLLLSSVTVFSQTTATDWYNKGLDLSNSKKYSEATTAFKKAVALSPTYTDAVYELGWCYNEIKQYDSAIRYLNKVLLLDKGHHVACYEIGYAYRQKEQYDQALKFFDKALVINPSYHLAHKDKGEVYKKLKQYDKAIESYRKCLDIDEDNDEAMYQLGYIYNDTGEYEKAASWLERSAALYKDEHVYNELGYAYYMLMKNTEAINAYNSSIASNAAGATAYKGLGDVYRSNFSPARTADAETNYRKALQYNEKNADTHYGLGWCYNEEEKFDEAIIELKKATELAPESTTAFVEYGYALYKKQRIDEAMAKLKKATSLNSKSKLGHYYTGLCYIYLKDKSNAIKTYDTLLTIDEKQAKTLKEKIDSM